MSIVAAIEEDTEAVKRHWRDPDSLSAILLRLATHYEGLGDLVTDAEYEMDTAKATYDHHADKRKLELVDGGEAAGVAESKAKVELVVDFNDYLDAKRKYGRLKRKREAVDRIIDAGRSRLSLIKGDIQRGA